MSWDCSHFHRLQSRQDEDVRRSACCPRTCPHPSAQIACSNRQHHTELSASQHGSSRNSPSKLAVYTNFIQTKKRKTNSKNCFCTSRAWRQNEGDKLGHLRLRSRQPCIPWVFLGRRQIFSGWTRNWCSELKSECKTASFLCSCHLGKLWQTNVCSSSCSWFLPASVCCSALEKEQSWIPLEVIPDDTIVTGVVWCAKNWKSKSSVGHTRPGDDNSSSRLGVSEEFLLPVILALPLWILQWRHAFLHTHAWCWWLIWAVAAEWEEFA